MHKKQHLFAALVAFALVNTGLCFAQEESSEAASYESTEETPTEEATSEDAPVQAPQPVYYAVPSQPQAVQYVVVPAGQTNQPAMGQGPGVPVKERKSNVSLLFGVDLSFYLTGQSYDEDSEYDLSTSSDDVYASQTYDGKGFAGGISLGALIKDFVGIRGFVNVGMQSGETSYENKDVRCDSCHDISTDLTDVRFGVEGTFFPFNSSRGAMYNAYIDLMIGVAVHVFDDPFAADFEREVTATAVTKFEVGKLFPISESWNVGFGVAYSLDFQYEYTTSNTQEIDYSDLANSLWVGIKFVRKKNKTE